MASIIVMTGAQEGDFYQLDESENIVGRSADVPIRIVDATISRKHMKIAFDPQIGRYQAIDLASRCGVQVNGRKISAPAWLVDGDCITIGQTVLVFTTAPVVDREAAIAYIKQSRLEFPTLDPAGASEANIANSKASLLRWAAASGATLAVVFTDVVDSTALTQSLGNERFNAVRRADYARTRSLVGRYQGHEVKTSGDGFLLVFHTAANALAFALDLDDDTGDPNVRIRSGIHIGPVTVEQSDIHGAAVNYAARVIELATEGGIWVSDDIKNHIDQDKPPFYQTLRWQSHPGCALKGFQGDQTLWSVTNCPDSSVSGQT